MKYLKPKKTKYKFNEPDANILETFENSHTNLYLVPFIQDRDEFTSLCPVTGQPDYARFEIIYVPKDTCIESKSLKLYLMSYRNHGEFHEDVTNKICNDLFDILFPRYIRVYGDFASRGGLAIKPIVIKWGLTKQGQQAEIKELVRAWDIKK